MSLRYETSPRVPRSLILLTPRSHRVLSNRLESRMHVSPRYRATGSFAREFQRLAYLSREENSKWNGAYLRRQSGNNESTKGCFRFYDSLLTGPMGYPSSREVPRKYAAFPRVRRTNSFSNAKSTRQYSEVGDATRITRRAGRVPEILDSAATARAN